MSTGPKTAAGKAASREASRASMIARWQRMKSDGVSNIPLTEAGRKRLRHRSRRNMRMRHRKQQALRWADWLMEQHREHTTRVFFTRTRNIILQPFKKAIEHGGYEELIEMASFTGLNLENVPDGTDLYGVILGRYRNNIKKLADEFSSRCRVKTFRTSQRARARAHHGVPMHRPIYPKSVRERKQEILAN